MYFTYATVSESNIMAYANNSSTFFFQVSLLHLISFQYWLSFTIIPFACTEWGTFMFLTHMGKKSQYFRRGNYMSYMITMWQ